MSHHTHHHTSYSDFHSGRRSEPQSYQVPFLNDKQCEFRSDGGLCYPQLEHVPGLVRGQNFILNDTGHGTVLDRGTSEQQSLSQPHHELYLIPPHVETQNYVAQMNYQVAPRSWPPVDASTSLTSSQICPQYHSLPSYPSTRRLTPPSIVQPSGSDLMNTSTRLTLAGSLDPSTGIFYRTPEHPRLRTAQACEKCRTRKAKCSGEHPSCKRCTIRGLVCEYAKEGRVRGPNKPKTKVDPANTKEESSKTKLSSLSISAKGNYMSTPAPNIAQATHEAQKQRVVPVHYHDSMSLGERRPSRPRPPNLCLESSLNPRLTEGSRSPAVGHLMSASMNSSGAQTYQPLNMVSVAHLLSTYGETSGMYDDSGSSTSSNNDRYRQGKSVYREPSNSSRSESESISNPPSAVSSTFDTSFTGVVSPAPIPFTPPLMNAYGSDGVYHAFNGHNPHTATLGGADSRYHAQIGENAGDWADIQPQPELRLNPNTYDHGQNHFRGNVDEGLGMVAAVYEQSTSIHTHAQYSDLQMH